MIRYLDSGVDGTDACLGKLLDSEIISGIKSFRGQFGYYDGSALRGYLPVFEESVANAGLFRLVIGANGSDPPTIEDLRALIPLMQDERGTASLTIVALAGALFHPKTLHILRADESALAVVGSANLTAKGLGHNAEAAVLVEEAELTTEFLARVAASIDHWSTCTEPGVYQVSSEDDIERLVDLKLAVSAHDKKRIRVSHRAKVGSTGRGGRQVGWRPVAQPKPEDDLPELEGTGEEAGEAVSDGALERGLIELRWCKKLSRSDALQTPIGTNPTGKLRLGKARHDIDKDVFFRDELFGDEDWIDVRRSGKPVEEAHVDFEVTLDGEYKSKMRLLVDHGVHRIANQNNVPTVLAWGTELSTWLRDNPHTNNWVVIERDSNGTNWLTIQSEKPVWAP